MKVSGISRRVIPAHHTVTLIKPASIRYRGEEIHGHPKNP